MGPRGGAFVRTADGKRLRPASGGGPRIISMSPNRVKFMHMPARRTNETAILPFPRSPPATAKAAYENGVRVRALPFKHSNMNTANIGINAYRDYAEKHWPRELFARFEAGLYGINASSPSPPKKKKKSKKAAK